MRFFMKYTLLIMSLWIGSIQAAEVATLTQDTQAVKQAVLQLNKDLYELEKQLLSPATTEVSFYLSFRGLKDFIPLALEVNTQGAPSVHHLYTEREVEALRMGAVQPVASRNIGPGLHDVDVILRGKNRDGVEKVISLQEQVEKQTAPLLLEILVTDNQGSTDPIAQLNTWR